MPGVTPDLHGGYVALIHSLGVRTAELHAALARPTGDPAFDPEPIMPADVARWTQRLRSDATAVLDMLDPRRATLPDPARAEAERLLARRDELLARIDALAASGGGGTKIRVHGDYHLAQVLVVQNDFVIADFEGEPGRSLSERAEKRTAMKDVAGMLRSFDYAMHAALLQVGPVATETRAQLVDVGRAMAVRDADDVPGWLRPRRADDGVGITARRRSRAARADAVGKGRLRAQIRARQPPGLGAHPAGRLV